MAPLGVIGEIYIVSIAVGSIYLTVGLLLGQWHGHGNSTAGSDGHGDLTAGGHGPGEAAIDHGGSSSLGHEPGGLNHGGSSLNHAISGPAHAGHPFSPDSTGGHHLGSNSHATLMHSEASAGQHDAPHLDLYPTGAHPQHSDAGGHPQVVQVIEKKAYKAGKALLTLLSPMTLATFLAFFGISGLLCAHLFPVLGALTLLPAILTSMLITSQVLRLLRLMVHKMDVSSVVQAQEIIGRRGEILTPISSGRVGEVTYVIGSKRLNAPAKSAQPGYEFKLGDKVMISDFRDSIVYVEPYEDLLLDDSNSIAFPTKIKEE